MQQLTEEDILHTMIEIEPLDQDSFLKVKETLTRIGISGSSQDDPDSKPTLWQSIHIFHKKGIYYLTHFKSLFLLDGRFERTEITPEDLIRLNQVANLLAEWNLITLKHEPIEAEPVKLTIIPYRDKNRWNLRTKYQIGTQKKRS